MITDGVPTGKEGSRQASREEGSRQAQPVCEEECKCWQGWSEVFEVWRIGQVLGY